VGIEEDWTNGVGENEDKVLLPIYTDMKWVKIQLPNKYQNRGKQSEIKCGKNKLHERSVLSKTI
jgi:hypothetical protein